MKVLVTGEGMVTESAIDALLERGHAVRLLAVAAEQAAHAWPHGVEPWTADLGHGRGVEHCASGCDAVLHVALPPAGHPSTLAVPRIVRSTRRLLTEAARERRPPRIILVSSLDADRGTSEPARALRQAEAVILAGSDGPDATVVRTGLVYGPGEGLVALLLRLVRTLPALPLPDGGRPMVQPLWHEDLGRALSAVIERADLGGRRLEVAGPERISLAALAERLSALAGRRAPRISVPGLLATIGAEVAAIAGATLPLSAAEVAVIGNGSVLPAGRINALQAVLGVRPTGLQAGLARLASSTAEQPPARGTGPLVERRHWVDVHDPVRGARALCDDFQRHALEILDARLPAPAAATRRLRKGVRLWLAVPGRGLVGMRVAEVGREHFTAVTLDGHPLAGLVTIRFLEKGRDVRLEVVVQARAAGALDRVVQTLGVTLQDADWAAALGRMVERSGGTASDTARTSTRILEGDEAAAVERRAETLVLRARRDHAPASTRRTRAAARVIAKV